MPHPHCHYHRIHWPHKNTNHSRLTVHILTSELIQQKSNSTQSRRYQYKVNVTYISKSTRGGNGKVANKSLYSVRDVIYARDPVLVTANRNVRYALVSRFVVWWPRRTSRLSIHKSVWRHSHTATVHCPGNRPRTVDVRPHHGKVARTSATRRAARV